MIEFPPQISQEEYLKVLLTDPLEKLKAIIEKNNDKYSYWSDVKYQKAPEGISSKELWCYIKASRRAKRIIVWKKYGISISITNAMQRMCHEFDMNFGGSWGSNSIIPAENKEQYLISSLMEEAISSSQMEGAATTRKVAKEMRECNSNSVWFLFRLNLYKYNFFFLDLQMLLKAVFGCVQGRRGTSRLYTLAHIWEVPFLCV